MSTHRHRRLCRRTMSAPREMSEKSGYLMPLVLLVALVLPTDAVLPLLKVAVRGRCPAYRQRLCESEFEFWDVRDIFSLLIADRHKCITRVHLKERQCVNNTRLE